MTRKIFNLRTLKKWGGNKAKMYLNSPARHKLFMHNDILLPGFRNRNNVIVRIVNGRN